MKLISVRTKLVPFLVISAIFLTFSSSFATDLKLRLKLQPLSYQYGSDICPTGKEFDYKVDLDNLTPQGGVSFDSPNTTVKIEIDEGFLIVDDLYDKLPVTSIVTANGKRTITADYGDFSEDSSQEISIRLKPVMTGDLKLSAEFKGDLFDPDETNNSSSASCSSEGATMTVNGMPTYGLDLVNGLPTYQVSGDQFSVSLNNNLSNQGKDLDYYLVAELPDGSYYSMLSPDNWQKGIMPAYSGPSIHFDDYPAINFGRLPAGEYKLHYGLALSYDITGETEQEPLEIISLSSLRLIF